VLVQALTAEPTLRSVELLHRARQEEIVHFFASRLKYSRWAAVTLVVDEQVESLNRSWRTSAPASDEPAATIGSRYGVDATETRRRNQLGSMSRIHKCTFLRPPSPRDACASGARYPAKPVLMPNLATGAPLGWRGAVQRTRGSRS
jgi:hypothetical protein